jgi:hypothetical protein
LPKDRKGANKTLDYFSWARKEKRTAPFPNAKEYELLKAKPMKEEDLEPFKVHTFRLLQPP